MINVLEKDGATIISIEKATAKEYNLIAQAKVLRKEYEKSNDKAKMFAHFKCNQGKKTPYEEEKEIGQALNLGEQPDRPELSPSTVETATDEECDENAMKEFLESLDDYVEIIGLEGFA